MLGRQIKKIQQNSTIYPKGLKNFCLLLSVKKNSLTVWIIVYQILFVFRKLKVQTVRVT